MMSSKSRKFKVSPLRFQMIGGLKSPRMAQVSTVLSPTVTVVTLTRSSGARLSRSTSAERKETVVRGGQAQAQGVEAAPQANDHRFT